MLLSELKESYPSIFKQAETDLEAWYKSPSCPWSRIYNQGKLAGYNEVLERYDLRVTGNDSVINIDLILKASNMRVFSKFYVI